MEELDLLLEKGREALELKFPFAAVISQETSKNAILATIVNPDIHSLLIWGNPGTAKTTMAYSIPDIAPDIPTKIGCPFHCLEGQNCPHCPEESEVMKEKPPFGDVSPGVLRGTLEKLKKGQDLKENILATLNNGFILLDGIGDFEPDLLLDVLEMASGNSDYEWHPQFTVVGTYDSRTEEPPQVVEHFNIFARTIVVDDLERRIEITKRSMNFVERPREIVDQFNRENRNIKSRLSKAMMDLEKTFLTEKAKEHLEKLTNEEQREIVKKTAKTLAALDGKRWGSVEDVDEAFLLAVENKEMLVGGSVRL